ncbi:N-acetylglucosamine kinase [Marinigracilibium pacificum]|uniref:N-acetylglucosamine kinase n=1 Tax=Marinigracilibium pacificum TaxID=2729599 RepID=A0A848J2I7_9BACT|nr:N-acetylglucosamine kinase [Marinigracilibium pacificum]NMM49715.1 N-acetylglucosamine kinase [Marinigracilibium pacificum]
MIYIVDSGGTGADWRFINSKGNFNQLHTQGLQAHQSSKSDFEAVFQQVKDFAEEKPDKIYFYGAGCHRTEPAEKVKALLIAVWPEATIHVYGDVMAAAQSSCGNAAGISCILGTGASAVYFDGEKIVKVSPSLGYLLGDEGSGADLGKVLLKARLENKMPKDLAGFFDKRFGSPDEVLGALYAAENKQKYLGSFTRFMMQHMNKPWMARLIYDRFSIFIKQIKENFGDKINEVPIHFTGGVAFYFSNLLRQVANDEGVTVRNISETPIAGLTLYHQQLIESTSK